MTVIDSLLYKSGRDVQEIEVEGTNVERMWRVWTPQMEAESRFKGYQRARAKQFRRESRGEGFTLGDVVDVLGEVFASDAGTEWVVLESVRRIDVYTGLFRQWHDDREETTPAA
jgi:hypothetical protein